MAEFTAIQRIVNARARLLPALALAILSTGCVRAGANPPRVGTTGYVHSHLALSAIHGWSGFPIYGSVMSDGLSGDALSLGIWPIGEIGVGVVGARVQLLVFDIGLGIVPYAPEPRAWGVPDIGAGGEESGNDRKSEQAPDGKPDAD